MFEFHGTVETEHASKYLQQLCKHFAHKVDVEYDPHRGKVSFPMGFCAMAAEGNVLTFFAMCKEEEAIPVIKGIIDSHLPTFAWREDGLAAQWGEGLPEVMPEDIRVLLKTAA